jgi:DNA-binding GntR family transcriptional regulator
MPRSKPPSAKQRAYEHIKAQILTTGRFESDFLVEETVAAELGLSRTPVREAFLRLAAEELLQLVPGKGAFIPAVTDREVANVMEVRSLVEVHAALRLQALPAAQRDAILTRLADVHANQEQLLAADPVEFIASDREFHRVIIGATDNPVLSDFYERLRDRQIRMDARAHQSDPHRLASVLEEHGRILRSLGGSDAAELAAVVQAHLNATADAVR